MGEEDRAVRREVEKDESAPGFLLADDEHHRAGQLPVAREFILERGVGQRGKGFFADAARNFQAGRFALQPMNGERAVGAAADDEVGALQRDQGSVVGFFRGGAFQQAADDAVPAVVPEQRDGLPVALQRLQVRGRVGDQIDPCRVVAELTVVLVRGGPGCAEVDRSVLQKELPILVESRGWRLVLQYFLIRQCRCGLRGAAGQQQCQARQQGGNQRECDRPGHLLILLLPRQCVNPRQAGSAQRALRQRSISPLPQKVQAISRLCFWPWAIGITRVSTG